MEKSDAINCPLLQSIKEKLDGKYTEAMCRKEPFHKEGASTVDNTWNTPLWKRVPAGGGAYLRTSLK